VLRCIYPGEHTSQERNVEQPNDEWGPMFTIACCITTAIVTVWLTAIVQMAVKNFFLEHAMRASAYWQQRARQAEAILEQMAGRRYEDHPWWTNRP
jgi:hypothetical protein